MALLTDAVFPLARDTYAVVVGVVKVQGLQQHHQLADERPAGGRVPNVDGAAEGRVGTDG
ncbi:hypothetical protein [Streptomyces erythrochromogenes]|uniref:hypothetical protein n=1 Tax=Streptomyces erythrochromogenes TaxID=285574 RepID=UPI0038062AED